MHFSDLKVKDVVHCRAEEEAMILFEELNNIGITKWISGDPLENTYFQHDKGDGIYYFLNGKIDEIRLTYYWEWYEYEREGGYTLYEFNELTRGAISLEPQSNQSFMDMLGG